MNNKLRAKNHVLRFFDKPQNDYISVILNGSEGSKTFHYSLLLIHCLIMSRHLLKHIPDREIIGASCLAYPTVYAVCSAYSLSVVPVGCPLL